MKKDIHPKWYPEAKVICNGEVVMTVGSTRPELRVDVWSGNHPFFTGEQRIIDTAGQVERFMKRLDSYSSHKSAETTRQQKNRQKIEQRFMRQQLAALELSDRVAQSLHDANIITISDLTNKLEKGRDSLLKLEGLDEKVLADLDTKLADARESYFASAK